MSSSAAELQPESSSHPQKVLGIWMVAHQASRSVRDQAGRSDRATIFCPYSWGLAQIVRDGGGAVKKAASGDPGSEIALRSPEPANAITE